MRRKDSARIREGWRETLDYMCKSSDKWMHRALIATYRLAGERHPLEAYMPDDVAWVESESERIKNGERALTPPEREPKGGGGDAGEA